MSELNVLLVSDGRPGHFRLSEGIAAAIGRRRSVALRRLEVRRPRWLPGRIQSGLVNAGADAAVAHLLKVPLRPVAACDLVVSAGADTLAANVALSRAYGCPNIFYGSLRRYDPAYFALVLTSYAANAHKQSHAMALKPSAFDPDTLPVPQHAAPMTLALLIGGDSGTVRYEPGDWEALLQLVERPHAGIRWVVSNSRRTPDGVSARLAAMVAAGHLSFIDVRQPAAAGLVDLLAKCAVVAVTVDSSSMISEAVWARRPVVVLAPKHWTLPPLEQSYRDWMSARHWITPAAALRTTDAGAILQTARSLTPMTANPLDDLAALMASRLPHLFAQ